MKAVIFLVLTVAVIILAVWWLIDHLFFAHARRAANRKKPAILAFVEIGCLALLVLLLTWAFLVKSYFLPENLFQHLGKQGVIILLQQRNYGERQPMLNYRAVRISAANNKEMLITK